MKKVLLVIVGLLLFSNLTKAQVFADFETGLNGYALLGWGPAITDLQQVADPTGTSDGSLQLTYNAAIGQSGQVHLSNVGSTTASLLIYYIYLPADTPDSLGIIIFCQDNANWNHTTQTYYAVDIPKATWFPIYFPLEQWQIKKDNFNVVDNGFGWFGVEIQSFALSGADAFWQGNILLDNVSWIGVKPEVLADFEINDGGYQILNWSTGLTALSRVPDPTSESDGVLQLTLDANAGSQGQIHKSGVSSNTSPYLVYYVYLPADVPNDANFYIFAQDNSHWSHITQQINVADIPKEKWYPIYFPLEALQIKNPTTFDVVNNGFGWFGLQMDFGSWAGGYILVDNVSFLNDVAEEKWVLNDFESLFNPTGGFVLVNWGPSFTALTNTAIGNNRVLEGTLNLSVGINNNTEGKGTIQKDNVTLYSALEQKSATAITIDIFVPADCPLGGQVSIAYSGLATNWGWLEDKLMIDNLGTDGSFPRGEWVTLTFDAATRITSGDIVDPTQPGTVYIQFYYEPTSYAAAAGWSGPVHFDNLTLVGLSKPEGEVVAPNTTASVVTYTLLSGQDYQFVRFDWEDNALGTETYNIYMSEQPITDVTAQGVKKIYAGIPHGMQLYGWRPWTSDGSEKTYYFAITAFDGVAETALNDQCKVGPFTLTTTETYRVQYVENFASAFVLDGDASEFAPYLTNIVTPEDGSYADDALDWLTASTDMNYSITFVIDDNYLYISADVVDDDLRVDAAAQAWEGDALELFMGFYDVRPLTEPHAKNFTNANGDWRIGFMSDGSTALDGGSPTTIDGVEATVFQKFSQDGYIIEAKLDLDKMAAGGTFQLANGMMMPFKIDGTDQDPSLGDTQRSLIVQVGGMPNDDDISGDQTWLRPDAWGYIEVIGGTDVAEGSGLPTVYALYNNYPNPFNPATKIKYDLPKESQVIIKIYDILGREITTLVNENQKAGYYEVDFNASRLATGVYVYRIIAGDFVQSKKMMLMK